MSKSVSECLYLYGIADGCQRLTFGKIGIEGSEVYTIPCKGFSAIVHNCPPEPYKSEDRRVMEKWIRAHESVLDVAMKKFGEVIPLRFDTIIKPEDHSTSRSMLQKWLSWEFEGLRRKMERIRKRREYGVQIFYAPHAVMEEIVRKNGELAKIKESIGSGSEGSAYMRRLKLESMVRKELEASIARYYKDFYGRIQGEVDGVRVERIVKVNEGMKMLMNLSLLANDEQARTVGSSLDKVEKEGFAVRFTGPWPPYSFV
ncbi:MAG: GvpL/GvpF family gas vesicle protein [Thaumarchaeota archaeon]|nr:GvpL/GvpF family gas vesicle protein [Nitrososphaerota archaeon]